VFTSLIELTLDEVSRSAPQANRIGLLASSGCLQADIYGRAARERGLECVSASLDEEEAFMALLYRIKAGDLGESSRTEMRKLAECLIQRGADAIIAACTEVPLVLDGNELTVPFVSSTDVLVSYVVSEGTGSKA
jgi:aspartate racemase